MAGIIGTEAGGGGCEGATTPQISDTHCWPNKQVCLATVLGGRFQRRGPTWISQSDLNHVCMGTGVGLRSTSIEILTSDFLWINSDFYKGLNEMATSAGSQT